MVTAATDQLTPRRFALVFGTGLLALGVVGFAATGLGDPFTDHGASVLGFGVNPAANLLHLGTGVALLASGGSGHDAARHAAMLTTSAYLLLGMLGLVLRGSTANVLGVNSATVVLHLATGVFAAAAVGWRGRGREPGKPVRHWLRTTSDDHPVHADPRDHQP